jgi:hypothetical protein
MTYHAVENYLRRFRKEAKEMKGGAPVAPIPSTPKAKKASVVSPTKAGKVSWIPSHYHHFVNGDTGVKSGRIAKRAPATKIKAEAIEEEMNGEAELDEEEI